MCTAWRSAPDGTRITSGGADKTLQLWPTYPDPTSAMCAKQHEPPAVAGLDVAGHRTHQGLSGTSDHAGRPSPLTANGDSALRSNEAVLLAVDGAFAPAALFAATHPSRTTALVVFEGYADPLAEVQGRVDPLESRAAMVAMWGTGEVQHVVNPDMPWNEEIRATWARMERLSASPGTVALMLPLTAELNVRALLPSIRVPTLVLQHSDDPPIVPTMGKYVADHIPGAKYVELPGRNMYHFVEPWCPSFQEIAEFLTGHQAEVADDRRHPA
jgi:hypothetical protein